MRVIIGSALLLSIAIAHPALAQPAASQPIQPPPTPDEIAQLRAFYPERALAQSVVGNADLHCRIGAGWNFEACRVTQETPAGLGFGEAAVRAAQSQGPHPNGHRGGGELDMHVLFAPTPPYMSPNFARPARIVTNPSYRTQPTARQVADAFPAAARPGRVQGRVVLACEIAVTGLAENCRAQSESPPGFGFAEAAIRLMGLYRFNPRTVNGEPVGGAQAVFPLNFRAP